MEAQNRKQGRRCLLNDDVLVLILNKFIDNDDRRSFCLVCKNWLKLERLNRFSIRLYRPAFLRRRLLTRFPNAVHIEIRYIPTEEDLEYIAEACPQMKILKVKKLTSYCSLRERGLTAVGNRCPKLTKVSLRGGFIRESGVVALLHSAHNLTSVTLASNTRITDQSLCVIASALPCITSLKLKGCTSITDGGIRYLAEGCTSKKLKRLVINLCMQYCCTPKITNTGVKHLSKMSSLEYLRLSLCGQNITDIGGLAISKIQTLKELKLHSLMGVSDTTIVALAENCHNLETLDLEWLGGVTRIGINDAFSGHKCLKHLSLDGRNLVPLI